MKKLFYVLLAIILLSFGCKKENPKGSDNIDFSTGFHVQVVGGNFQRDTVGNTLKDSIIVKVTDNGSPVEGYIVQFKRSGCEDFTVSEKTSSAAGRASFAWNLSGETGDQSLTIVLMDANRNKKDSVSAAATGIAALQGWHKGGCLQNFPVNNVKALSSGRILASQNLTGYVYYSDDNAVSWHPLKTFSKNYFVSKIVTSGTNVFLATRDDGIFYSSDNGQSWTNISSGILNVLNFSDFAYTRSGRLIYTNDSGVFVSDDMGQNWNEEDYGLPMGAATYPCENANGDLFIIGSDATVYELPLHTSNWINIGSSGGYILASVECIYIDDKDDMYVSGPHNGISGTGYIYESADGGTSWVQVFSQQHFGSVYPNITEINKINGKYYFSYAGLGVFQTGDFNQFTNMTQAAWDTGLLTYTVSKNSTFVLGSPGFGVFSRVP